MNRITLIILFMLFLACKSEILNAQVKQHEDPFFLLQKKGLLKKLGESIYRDIEIESDIVNVVKNVDPFLKYDGKRIRFISIAPTGFYTIVHDTVDGKKGNFLENVGDFFHKNTLPRIVRKNLFFKEGDKILPREFSDNERFLREQPFFRDARIVVKEDSTSTFVDVIILTRDVFSLGASANVSNLTKVESVITEENILGTGNKLEFSGLYDKERLNDFGFGAAFTKRNLKGTFINWNTGFKNFNAAFNSSRQEENVLYTSFDKPLLSRYNAWTGNATVSYNETKNQYIDDSVFNKSYRYKVLSTDIWGGFNIGYKRKKEEDSDNRLRHFVGIRGFYNKFFSVPEEIKNTFRSNYTDVNGFLGSYSLYKQNFYRTNFIYGFGRNEDVPEGLNATIIAGITNKQAVKRNYYGAEFDASTINKKGVFNKYTFRFGSNVRNKNLEDVDLLLGIDRFTKLIKLNSQWRNRNFASLSFTKQFKLSELNTRLNLQSGYGLPYYNGSGINADTRTTIKFESVFFNLKKFLGFRFAPFAFTDLSLLKPANEPLNNSQGYTAIGGGLRARNENLVFGTIELRGYYFPRIDDGLKNWRVEVTSKLRFNFNTNFIRRPDFVSAN
jgi:hypothetical protein